MLIQNAEGLQAKNAKTEGKVAKNVQSIFCPVRVHRLYTEKQQKIKYTL